MRQATEGFTIIEILVAVALLAVVLLVVLGSFSGLFSLSRQTTGQSAASTQAEAALEEVKGQWQDSNTYAVACIKVPTANQAPGGATITVVDEDASGNPITGTSYKPVYATDCTMASAPAGATTPASALRRVSVTTSAATTATPQTSVLVMEVARP